MSICRILCALNFHQWKTLHSRPSLANDLIQGEPIFVDEIKWRERVRRTDALTMIRHRGCSCCGKTGRVEELETVEEYTTRLADLAIAEDSK